MFNAFLSMKKPLILLSLSLLLSSCIVVKVYELPASSTEPPKLIKKQRQMFSSDLIVPFPEEGTEILFFGEDTFLDPIPYPSSQDSLKQGDSLSKKTKVIKFDGDTADRFSWPSDVSKTVEEGLHDHHEATEKRGSLIVINGKAGEKGRHRVILIETKKD